MANGIKVDRIERRAQYTLVRIGPTIRFEQLRDIERWCYQTQCGKRVNINSFAFRDDAELTMFQLKWL